MKDGDGYIPSEYLLNLHVIQDLQATMEELGNVNLILAAAQLGISPDNIETSTL